jgi:hypothetical protein
LKLHQQVYEAARRRLVQPALAGFALLLQRIHSPVSHPMLPKIAQFRSVANKISL